MAKATEGQLTVQAPAKSRGRLSFRQTKHGAVFQKWPEPRGKSRSGFRYYQQLEFGWAARAAATCDALDRETAENMCEGSLYVWRDVIVRAMYGNWMTVIFPDGSVSKNYGENVPNAQLMLDQVTNVVGAMLFRTDVGWVGIMPGNSGQVLCINDKVPFWSDNSSEIISQAEFLLGGSFASFPNSRVLQSSSSVVLDNTVAGQLVPRRAALTGDVTAAQDSNALAIASRAVTASKIFALSGPGQLLGRKSAGSGDVEQITASDALDSLGTPAEGDVLYRDSGVWKFLAPGTAGQFLKTQGASQPVVWDNPSGGAGAGNGVVPYLGQSDVYITTPVLAQSALTSRLMTASRIYFAPFVVKNARTMTSIAVSIPNAGGVASSTARLGIYNEDVVNGGPSTVELDAGTVATATAGLAAIGISHTLAPGTYYFAIWCSAAITLRASASAATPANAGINLGSASPTTLTSLIFNSTYGGSFASMVGNTMTVEANAAVPLAGVR